MEESYSVDSIYENINNINKYELIITNLKNITESEYCYIFYNSEIDNISSSRDSSNGSDVDTITYKSQVLIKCSEQCNYIGILNYINLDLLSNKICVINDVDENINKLFSHY